MYLKSLHIVGFKSFAQKVHLEFPHGMTAVVGPNGSGKSNLVEALRWVMGEQSMKSLRAKKSEELIYSGSANVPRQSRAEVEITLDNTDRVFPLDFDEVVITRKVFRDGESEYLLNRSQVRLKDIIEGLAKARIGVSGYSVIGQGLADALLDASPMERKDMIDEALGLKEFQMKKKESLDKLKQTKNNIAQSDAIVGELTPHLRFLRRQAGKIEQRKIIEEHLKDVILFFCAKEMEILETAHLGFDQERKSITQNIARAQEELSITEQLLAQQSAVGEEGVSLEIEKLQEDLNAWQDRKMSNERDLARIEVQLAVQESKRQANEDIPVTKEYIVSALRNIYATLSSMDGIEDVGLLRGGVKDVIALFNALIAEIESGKKTVQRDLSPIEEMIRTLLKEKETLVAKRNEADSNIASARNAMREKQRGMSDERQKIFDLKDRQHAKRMELSKCNDELVMVGEREQRLIVRKRDFEQQMAFLNETEQQMVNKKQVFEKLSIQDRKETLESFDADALRREIEKLKARLEVAQDVDPDIEKEYEETKTRYEFLVAQLEDLKKSSETLKEIIKELDDRIETIFKEGFKVVNEEFNKFFRMLFSGGKASLVRKTQVAIKVKNAEEETEEGSKSDEQQPEELLEEKEAGIEISVDLPGKRVHSAEALSGGERSLTSVALLFALVSFASPPFLVVDEVDAALDETNSFRFAKILKDLSMKTQFVAITHNRETMRHSDVLYGLTMNKDGISNMLSIKFEEAEKV